jgi:Flp pilus assembly protein TadD
VQPNPDKNHIAGPSSMRSGALTIAALWLLAFGPGTAAAACERWVARLVSFQGLVEYQAAATGLWVPAAIDQTFCPGDRLRTQARSRAALQLENQTYLNLDQRSSVVFSGSQSDRSWWIDLLKGALLARSRTPKPLEIRSPFINAAIRGTEFLVRAEADRGEVAVFEGEVLASNGAGRVAIGRGQSASAGRGEAPRAGLAVRSEDSVSWALYYPPLLDLPGLLKRTGRPELAEATRLFASGQPRGALDVLERVPPEHRDGEDLAVRVGLLLHLGRLDEAAPLLAEARRRGAEPALADALDAVIALAGNRGAEALRLSGRAVQARPDLAVAWIARSYALQGAFDLNNALAAADRARQLDPGNALVAARRAELLASLDRWAEARVAAAEATRLDRRQARAYTVKGFAELRDIDLAAAEGSFQTAVRLNSADPLARMGLAMVAIRRGKLEQGTAGLEIAASLDPGDSLIRSYLGKAYFEQNRNRVAEQEFGQARQFDPRDPTPWFYDAIRKQTENRPVEALHDLQKAIALNGNRAVYRSKLTLDQDLAARSAALARIYQNLGFTPRALVEGWTSATLDPANFSAHRLLADSYAAMPGQEAARASELLQSQLLQPLNSTPIQPHLAENRLLIPAFSGPAQMSFNEFNPVFSRNGVNLLATGLVGSLDTYGNETALSGILNRYSGNLGQLHYQTNGYRPNNDLNQNIYSVFAQTAVTPDFSLQAEYRHRDLEHGDLFQNGNLQEFDPNFRRTLTTDVGRAGVRFSPTPHSQVLGSVTYFDSMDRANFFGLPASSGQSGFIGEAQYLHRHAAFNTIVGAGQQSVTGRQAIDHPEYPATPLTFDMNLTNAYLYSQVRLPKDWTWILGFSVDASSSQSFGSHAQLNPKLGALYELTPNTLLRLAAFRSFIRGTEVDATIEPTQIAGFNQFIDGNYGTSVWHYGVGLDQRFLPGLFMGIEAARRDLSQPIPQDFALDVPIVNALQQENHLRSYANWAINDRLSAYADYLYSDYERPGTIYYANHIVPVGLNFFDPSGISLGTVVTYVNQDATVFEVPTHSSFALWDIALRYRLPRRHGLASLLVKNLLDRDFDFVGRNPYGYRTGRFEETPLFIPDRTIAFQLTLAF